MSKLKNSILSVVLLMIGIFTVTAEEKKSFIDDLYLFYDFDMPMRVNNAVYPISLANEGFLEGKYGKAYYYMMSGRNQYPNAVASGENAEQFSDVPRRRVQDERLDAGADTLLGGIDTSTEGAMVDDLVAADQKKKDPNTGRNRNELYDDPGYKNEKDALRFVNDSETPGIRGVESSNGRITVKDQTFGMNTQWRSGYRDALLASAYVKGEPGDELDVELALSPFPGDPEQARKKWFGILKKENPTIKSVVFVKDELFPQKVKLNGDWQRVAAYVTLDSRLNDRKVAFNLVSKNKKPIQAKKFQLEVRPEATPSPTEWMAGGKSHYGNPFLISGPSLLKNFPQEKGSLSFWVKYPDQSNLTHHTGIIFELDTICSLTEKTFYSGGKHLDTPLDSKDANWQHIAFTWDAQTVSVYKNGNYLTTQARGFVPNPDIAKKSIRLGYSGFQGRTGANLILDEFAVFKRNLNHDEIKELYNRTEPLLADSREYIGTPFSSLMFYRNENPARLIFSIFAPVDEAVTAKLKIDGISFPDTKLEIQKGKTRIVIPFTAYLLDTGTYPMELTMTNSKGELCYKSSGTVEILPRFERDEFKVLSWGGSSPLETNYSQMVGINAVNMSFDSPTEFVDDLTRRGIHLNPRLENNGEFYKTGYDKEKIASAVEYITDKFSGHSNWSMTLCNSEVYGIGNGNAAKDIVPWREFAKKELGHDPVFDLVNSVGGLKRPKGWKAPEDGIYEMDDATGTFLWLESKGQPPMLVNEINTKTIHKLSPGNIVWSEPGVPFGVDMTADWFYEYGTKNTLADLKKCSKNAHEGGAKHMPTLSMSYWPEQWGSIEDDEPLLEKKDKDDVMNILSGENDEADDRAQDTIKELNLKKPKISLQLAQTVDELKIKTYLSLGAVRADALSIFALDAWPTGEKNIAMPKLESRMLVADPDSGKRYGEAMHSTFYPMAMLLQDMESARTAKVALFAPATSAMNAQLGWCHYHYTRAFQSRMTSVFQDYDILGDGVSAEQLKQYKYIFFPAAQAVLRSNYDALMEAAKNGTTLYVDWYCRQKYPGMKRFDDQEPKKDITNWHYLAPQMKKTWENLSLILKNIQTEQKKDANIYAEGEKDTVFAFKRISDGDTPYFIIVNDARTTGPLNKFKKDDWYKPYGLEQVAKIVLKVPEKSVIYDFVTSKQVPYKFENGRAVIETTLAPAQGMVLCVYPHAFKDIKLEAQGLKPGSIGKLRVTLLDESGKLPRGRQIIWLELTDDKGKKRDESGWYRLVNGTADIPLYFSKNDKTKMLKAELTEKTSGLKKSETIPLP